MGKETSLYICPYLYLYIFHVKDHHLFGKVENRIEIFFFLVKIVEIKKNIIPAYIPIYDHKVTFFFSLHNIIGST